MVLLQYILGAVTASAWIGAVWSWGWQLYVFLRTGFSLEFSAIDLLKIFDDSPWLGSPSDWAGVHSMLSFVNGGLTLILIGFASLFLLNQLSDTRW